MTKFIDLAKFSMNKLEKEVNTCNYYAPTSIVSSMKFLDDSFHEPEINYKEYDGYKKTIDNLATKFSDDCICKKRYNFQIKKSTDYA